MVLSGRNLWLVVLFSLLWPHVTSVKCQPKNLLFDHLSVEDGLSQSTVFSIVQDQNGFVWMATRDGLNRYDSHEIKVYKNVPDDTTSLPSNQVNSIFNSSDGTLWIGTSDGLCIYKPETDNFTRLLHSRDDQKTISNNIIYTIYEDRDKNVWIGTREGLNKVISFNPFKVSRIYHKVNDPNSLLDNLVRVIYQDKHGFLWFGHNNGLGRLNKNQKNGFTFKAFPKAGYVNAIIDGENNDLWIGTEYSGLRAFDYQSGNIHSVNKSNAMFAKINSVRVLTKHKDLYWIGTIGGLYAFNPLRNECRKFISDAEDPLSLSDNSIRSVYFDRAGSLWIGTFYGGVNFYSPISKQFGYFKLHGNSFPLRYKNVSSIYEDHQKNLWFGIDGGGLFCFDRKTNSISTFIHKDEEPASISNDIVKSICPDEDKGLWIGTFRGLNYFSFKSRKFIDFSKLNHLTDSRIYDIRPDNEGNIWLATNGNGLWKINKETKIQEKVRLYSAGKTSLSEYLTTLLFDSQGRLWIGSSSGLNLKLPHTDSLQSQQLVFKILKGKSILVVFEDRFNHIWIGTRGNGLYKFDSRNNKVVQYTEKQGLPGKSVVGILEDKNGNLWMSTENGLSKFDLIRSRFNNYGKNDGLICKEFNTNAYSRDHAGRMYFGGYNGIVIFNPDSIVENSSVPQIVFTKLKLFNNEITIGSPDGIISKTLGEGQTLRFKYNQNIFSVQFAVLNYINPEKNRFAYKLNGFEKEWNISENPFATYMNLKPGKYTFLAKGCNNDGEWNNNPISLNVVILPPPWKTWWAFGSYGMVIILALLFFRRQLHIRFTLERNLYIEQVENRKQAELHQAKLQFFTNISHDLRTPLMLIISPLENIIRNISNKEERKQLQIVQYNANRLLRLINQLLDFRKQETQNLKLKVSQENIIEFVQNIYEAFFEFAKQREINLKFDSCSEKILVWFDKNELEKVFYNLLSNAVKFTSTGGKISISVAESSSDNWVEIIFEDNGPGIPQEHIDKVFNNFFQIEDKYILKEGYGIGLAITKGIVELHHGHIKAENVVTERGEIKGTRFTIKLLLGTNHFDEEEISRGNRVYEKVTMNNLSNEFGSVEFEEHTSMSNVQVLLVEDNVEVRSYIKSNLDHAYHILEAENGLEALNIIDKNLPDLIISDVMMPVMDGIELTKKLKSDEKTRHIPVILITARDAVEYQVKSLEKGADDYIVKPFNTLLLELKIRNLLNTSKHLKNKYSKVFTLEPKYEEVLGPDEKFMERLMGIIEKHMPDPEFNVSRLVELIGMSRPVLFRKVKALTGLSVLDVIKTTRLKKAAMLLKQKKMTVSEVGYSIGFSDSKYFSKAFRNHFGKSPSEYMGEH